MEYECVDGWIRISWLRMVKKMEALSSCLGMWKLGRRAFIWMVGPQCHLIFTDTIVDLVREL